MSPVHVIVGDDARAETMWSSAFTGAVDLYRFERNVDAFERLTAAQAQIDLVVLTPAQRGPFNLTPDQFVARVLEGPLGSSRYLANLHVIVVGQPLQRQHPRAMSVSTLDAAIRLVKFGEVEQAPRPASMAPVAAAPQRPTQDRARRDDASDLLDGLQFSGTVISRIWDEPREEQPVQPTRLTPIEDAPATSDHAGWCDDVVGGGPTPRGAHGAAAVPQAVTAPGPAQLFTRSAPKGFVAAGGGAAQHAPTPPSGHAPGVGAPGEAIEVASGTLQASRPYELPGGGAYRGPSVRGGVMHGAGYDVGGQPVPPALADQVHSMVYGGMQVGNPHDPLMVWSSTGRGAAPNMEAAPVPMGGVGAMQQVATVGPPVPMPAHAPIPQQPAAPPAVPMEPPAGAYGGPPAPPMSHAAQSDPFLQRAESGGGDVSFG